jgi:hypothetical protein
LYRVASVAWQGGPASQGNYVERETAEWHTEFGAGSRHSGDVCCVHQDSTPVEQALEQDLARVEGDVMVDGKMMRWV